MPTKEQMSSLAEEIVGSYAERIATITDLQKTVKLELRELQAHLEGLRDSRIATGRETKANLAKGAANRKYEVGGMISRFTTELKELNSSRSTMSQELKANLASSVTDGKHSVVTMLNGFNQALAALSKQMRTDLAKDTTERKHETDTLLEGFNSERKEIRSTLAGGQAEWQKLTATMQAHRGRASEEMKPLVVKAAKIAPEEITAFSNRAFDYLANHPDGTRMTQLEEELGLPRIQIARLLKNLMDENKVKKQELLYFAI